MRILYQIPSFLQGCYRHVTWRRNKHLPVVYLTFDDGPIPDITPTILDILDRYGVKATFFMVGENAEHYPALVDRIRRSGHSIGNHTYSHAKGTKCPQRVYLDNIKQAANVLNIHPASKGEKKPLFRPPYGKMTRKQKLEICKHYEIVLWDVLTHDYNRLYSPADMLSIVQHYTRNGSIINFHDSMRSNERTIEVLPLVIEWLRERYELAPL